jgi:hypothetical protein
MNSRNRSYLTGSGAMTSPTRASSKDMLPCAPVDVDDQQDADVRFDVGAVLGGFSGQNFFKCIGSAHGDIALNVDVMRTMFKERDCMSRSI